MQCSNKFHSDKTKSGLKLINPLAGVLVCKNCGKVMAYQPYKNRPGTDPRFLHQQSQLCKVKSAIASDVMAAVAHALKMYIEDYQLKVDNLPDVDENALQSQIEALQAEIRKIERKLAKLFDAWEEEKVSDNEFVERKTINTERIAAIKRQIDELEATVPEKDEYEEKILALSVALGALLDETLDADVKNAHLKTIVEKIEFSRENNEEFILDVVLR